MAPSLPIAQPCFRSAANLTELSVLPWGSGFCHSQGGGCCARGVPETTHTKTTANQKAGKRPTAAKRKLDRLNGKPRYMLTNILRDGQRISFVGSGQVNRMQNYRDQASRKLISAKWLLMQFGLASSSLCVSLRILKPLAKRSSILRLQLRCPVKPPWGILLLQPEEIFAGKTRIATFFREKHECDPHSLGACSLLCALKHRLPVRSSREWKLAK